jgi:S1-C subfamily serine protease
VLLIAAGAFGLTALLGSSGPKAATTAGLTATGATQPVKWLGMEIATLPPGTAVIETVRLGAPGDLAGLQPGDTIVEINHHAISGTPDISAAIRGLHAGDRVEMQISHGSASYGAVATLAAPPSAYP